MAVANLDESLRLDTETRGLVKEKNIQPYQYYKVGRHEDVCLLVSELVDECGYEFISQLAARFEVDLSTQSIEELKYQLVSHLHHSNMSSTRDICMFLRS